MASDSNLDLIRGNYARQSDQELIRIISQEAHDLTGDAVQIIKEELARRNLDPQLGNVVAAQNRDYSTLQLDELARIFENVICPKCHKATKPLTAAMISQTMSFLISMQQSNRIHIACPDCLKSECISSSATTLLLGWWSFPWGPVRSVESLANNFKAYAAVKVPGPNDFIREFIHDNLGLIEHYKNDKESIRKIIWNLHSNLPLNTNV